MAIRVISERIMSRGFEPAVQRLMDGVQDMVMRQPGFKSIEQLKDSNDHTKFIVLTEWESEKHLNTWLENPKYKKIIADLDKVLEHPAQYRVFSPPQDDIFLL